RPRRERSPSWGPANEEGRRDRRGDDPVPPAPPGDRKEMCFEATKMALDSAGLTRADIDMVVNGTAPDAFDGVDMKGESLLDGCGGYRKPYTRVFTGGGTGVFRQLTGR